MRCWLDEERRCGSWQLANGKWSKRTTWCGQRDDNYDDMIPTSDFEPGRQAAHVAINLGCSQHRSHRLRRRTILVDQPGGL